MTLNFKKINYINNKEIKKKILKTFLIKNNLGHSLRLINLQHFSIFLYHFVQIKNFCNINKKSRAVFRFIRFNRLIFAIFIKFGLIKNINKGSW